MTNNIFGFGITTKQLKIVYSPLIVKSKEALHKIKYNSNLQNIFLVNKPCMLKLSRKLNYIKSFASLKLNHGNLNYYLSNTTEIKFIIVNLISIFLLK
ncbi:conserved hypothetical protein (plasmid) [Borreliella garinii Far04]|nr:conserved hypothetical protein [Borreliella garinii Far04]